MFVCNHVQRLDLRRVMLLEIGVQGVRCGVEGVIVNKDNLFDILSIKANGKTDLNQKNVWDGWRK